MLVEKLLSDIENGLLKSINVSTPIYYISAITRDEDGDICRNKYWSIYQDKIELSIYEFDLTEEKQVGIINCNEYERLYYELFNFLINKGD